MSTERLKEKQVENRNCEHAVRIWVGYALPALKTSKGRNRFYKQLGDIFIPATVELMAPLGLYAYVPSVLEETGHPCAPDEIALVFYESQETYHRACNDSCAGRTYSALHGTLFSFEPQSGSPASHSGFPEPFRGDVSQSGAITLFDHSKNWQQGVVLSQVLLRSGLSSEVFRQNTCNLMRTLKQQTPDGLQGVYYYLNDDLFICWSLWQNGGRSFISDDLGSIILSAEARPVTVPSSVFATDPGLTVTPNDSLNLQFSPLSAHQNRGTG